MGGVIILPQIGTYLAWFDNICQATLDHRRPSANIALMPTSFPGWSALLNDSHLTTNLFYLADIVSYEIWIALEELRACHHPLLINN